MLLEALPMAESDQWIRCPKCGEWATPRHQQTGERDRPGPLAMSDPTITFYVCQNMHVVNADGTLRDP